MHACIFRREVVDLLAPCLLARVNVVVDCMPSDSSKCKLRDIR